MGLSMLFSVIMEKTAASILTSMAIWIFLMFFLPIIANAIANAIAPLDNATTSMQVKNYIINHNILRISPSSLFTESIAILLIPTGGHFLLRPVLSSDVSRMLLNPLSLSQSMIQIWPQLVAIIALAIICFAISYIIFMKKEIRST
jgi:ABC-2 type transport system permease protein